ncbi:hypothetical protein B0H19DRAFT_1069777 [Mycena capillaripes]|nr:hypothetical protein B0H19DRAFT_1069777 [Mycena capillaripes]
MTDTRVSGENLGKRAKNKPMMHRPSVRWRSGTARDSYAGAYGHPGAGVGLGLHPSKAYARVLPALHTPVGHDHGANGSGKVSGMRSPTRGEYGAGNREGEFGLGLWGARVEPQEVEAYGGAELGKKEHEEWGERAVSDDDGRTPLTWGGCFFAGCIFCCEDEWIALVLWSRRCPPVLLSPSPGHHFAAILFHPTRRGTPLSLFLRRHVHTIEPRQNEDVGKATVSPSIELEAKPTMTGGISKEVLWLGKSHYTGGFEQKKNIRVIRQKKSIRLPLCGEVEELYADLLHRGNLRYCVDYGRTEWSTSWRPKVAPVPSQENSNVI